MAVPFDYDAPPERYRLGMQIMRAHSTASLYNRIAAILTEQLVGIDVSAILLQAHPPSVVRADAARLPVRGGVADAVTAVNVLYHLSDPLPAIVEAHRVLRGGGHLLAATIARNDSPELHDYWSRPETSFDAEEAPGLLARVFDTLTVYPWDAPLVTLPSAAAIRDYLLGRQAPAHIADAAARDIPAPFTVTKRGALIHTTPSQHISPVS